MHWLPGLALDLHGNPGLRLTPVTITRPDPDLQIDSPYLTLACLVTTDWFGNPDSWLMVGTIAQSVQLTPLGAVGMTGFLC